MPSLCICDAVLGRLDNQISEETYLQCIIDHAAGVRHGANKLCNGRDTVLGSAAARHGNSNDPLAKYFASNVSQDVDPFASLLANWISSLPQDIGDTAPLHATLQAYRSGDAQAFEAGIHEMDKVYGTPDYSGGLCRKALAMHALLVRDAKMLEAVLDQYVDDIEWPFQKEYDRIKKKWWSEHKILRVVKKSGFKSACRNKCVGPCGFQGKHHIMDDYWD